MVSRLEELKQACCEVKIGETSKKRGEERRGKARPEDLRKEIPQAWREGFKNAGYGEESFTPSE